MRLPILVFHVSAGMLGVLSGAIAVTLRKGSRGIVWREKYSSYRC
jgi:hypothetical protein